MGVRVMRHMPWRCPPSSSSAIALPDDPSAIAPINNHSIFHLIIGPFSFDFQIYVLGTTAIAAVACPPERICPIWRPLHMKRVCRASDMFLTDPNRLHSLLQAGLKGSAMDPK